MLSNLWDTFTSYQNNEEEDLQMKMQAKIASFRNQIFDLRDK